MICALEMVDYVVRMDEDNPCALISELKPDVAVKGEDWKNKFVPEKSIIEGYGGTLEFIKMRDGISTTEIIKKVRNE